MARLFPHIQASDTEICSLSCIDDFSRLIDDCQISPSPLAGISYNYLYMHACQFLYMYWFMPEGYKLFTVIIGNQSTTVNRIQCQKLTSDTCTKMLFLRAVSFGYTVASHNYFEACNLIRSRVVESGGGKQPPGILDLINLHMHACACIYKHIVNMIVDELSCHPYIIVIG